MNVTEIRQYAAMMQELGLTGLEITADNSRVRLERSYTGTTTVMPAIAVDPGSASIGEAEDSAPMTGPSAAMLSAQGKSSAAANYTSVKSSIVGMFYAAPAENAEPYVKVGDHVTKGQTLCIVEAMKLMNEITADCDGTIDKICVTDGQVVEYGTELFRITQ